jgi:hypothetical protein
MKAIALDEISRPNWFDPERVRRLGGIFVIAPDLGSPANLHPLISHSIAHELSLPYRRTLSTKKQNYIYYFLAPRGC